MRSISTAALLANLRDSLLLERASRKLAESTPERQRRIRELYDAATVRASIAAELVDARQHGAAFTLLKEASALYLAAIAVSNDAASSEVLEPMTAFEGLDDLLARGLLPAPRPEAELHRVQSWFADSDPLAFDRLSHDEALMRRSELDEVVDYLRQLIEPRTLRELKLARGLRLGALGIVIVAVLSFAGWKAFSPKNLALGKPVTESSRHPQSTASPDGLTDGDTGGSYGVHTRIEDEAWVMVDLQSTQKIGRIKVFNRGDGHYDDGLPFALELSDNGKEFTEVDQRKTSFSRWKPWTYDAQGKQARFVRIRKVGRGYVALSELEVYGAR